MYNIDKKVEVYNMDLLNKKLNCSKTSLAMRKAAMALKRNKQLISKAQYEMEAKVSTKSFIDESIRKINRRTLTKPDNCKLKQK